MSQTTRESEKWLGKRVVARTIPGDVHGTGTCIGYTDEPTLVIKKDDGTRFSWRVSLCVLEQLTREQLQEKLEELQDAHDTLVAHHKWHHEYWDTEQERQGSE